MPTDCYVWGLLPTFLGGSDIKESAYPARDPASIPVSGRSPGEGNGNPLQYSGLENSTNTGYSLWGRKDSDMIERLTLSFLERRKFIWEGCTFYTLEQLSQNVRNIICRYNFMYTYFLSLVILYLQDLC